jgi:dihydrofolate reductase
MLSIIVAMDKNNVIGKNNDLPWHLPNDLKYFKGVTQNKTVVMGRKCFESIGRPLPNRKNIVLSRKPFIHDNVVWLPSVQDVLKLNGDIFIIGGAQIYEQFLPYASKLYITKIEHEFDGDTFFPRVNLDEWKQVSYKQGIKDEKNIYEHNFYVYEKRL